MHFLIFEIKRQMHLMFSMARTSNTPCTGNLVESMSCFPLHCTPSVFCLHVALYFHVSSGLCTSSNRCHLEKEKS